MQNFYPLKICFHRLSPFFNAICLSIRFINYFRFPGFTVCFLLLCSFFLANSLSLRSQSVGIFGSTSLGVNNTGAPGNASAIFDISSTAKGLLIPRMSTIQRNGITTPATSLMIFNTTSSQYEYFDGIAWVALANSGTVTSVGLSAPAIFTVSGSPVVSSGTLDLALNNQSANTVFAAPNGAAGTPSFRTLTAFDIPSLDASKITSGTFAIARGGTGLSTTPVNGQVLIGNGTGYTLSTLTAGAGISIANAPGSITIGTSGGTLSGGTTNYIPKWTSATSLSSISLIYDDGTNVGIGTATPTKKLHILQTGTSDALYVTTNGTGTVISAVQSGTSGNVGMFQITNPSNASHAFVVTTGGNGDAGSFQINQPAATGNAIYGSTIGTGSAAKFQNTNATATAGTRYGVSSTATGTNSGINVGGYFSASGAAANYAAIFENGNVGIGTTNPGSLLHVMGNIQLGFPSTVTGSIIFNNADNSNTIIIQSSAASPGYTLFLPSSQGAANTFLQNDGGGNLGWTAISGTLSGGTVNYIPKWASASSLSSTSLIYDNGTNVGIGITNPSAALEIQKPSAPTTELLRLRDNTGGKHIEFYSSAMRQRGGNLAFESYESGYTFSTGNPGTVKLAIQFGGNVGIGTTGPLAALDVVGQMYSRGNIVASSGSIDWNLGNNQTLQSATGSAITFTNMQDGGVYCLFITDGASRTYTFSGTGLTFNFIQPNAATTAGQATLYKFNRIGSSVYVDWGPFGNSPLAGSGTANYIPKWSSATGLSSTSLLYDNGTNVGIGTTSPSHLFHIHETTINPYLHFTDDMTGTLSSDGLILGTNGAGSTYLINQETSYDLHIGNATDNNLITIKGNANAVGIGTTLPATKLDVRTSSGGYAAQFVNSETSISDIGGIYGLANGANGVGTSKYGGLFQTANGAGTNYGIYGEAISGTGTNIGGYFSASGGASNYAIIVPSTGGNVGIGTTAPSAKLHIQNSGSVGFTPNTSFDKLIIENSASSQGSMIQLAANATSGTSGIGFSTITRNIGSINYAHATNSMFFSTNSTTRMTINSTGNVGIGTTNPTAKLQVAGDVALGTGLTTGNEPVTVYLTNASGGSVSNGMIVITGSSNNSFTTTNAANDTRAIGVVYDASIAAGAVGRVAIAGVVLVYHAGAIIAADRGKHVVTSNTPGQAAVVTNPVSGASIGIVMEAPISAGLRGRMLLR